MIGTAEGGCATFQQPRAAVPLGRVWERTMNDEMQVVISHLTKRFAQR